MPSGDPFFNLPPKGEGDMPARVRTALNAVNLSLPGAAARLVVGRRGRGFTFGRTAGWRPNDAWPAPSSGNKLAKVELGLAIVMLCGLIIFSRERLLKAEVKT